MRGYRSNDRRPVYGRSRSASPGSSWTVLDRVLQTARSDRYEGYSKHDGLNAPVLARLAGNRGSARLAAIQIGDPQPRRLRPMVGVRKARNAKGLSLFARALLARHRMTGSAEDAREARAAARLADRPSGATDSTGLCWGYPYPWQDVGFFAPRDFPNRVVTSFVGQALLDGYETLETPATSMPPSHAVRFLLEAPKTLFEDDRPLVPQLRAGPRHRLDRHGRLGPGRGPGGPARRDRRTTPSSSAEGGRLVRYVVSKQTDDGAWFYTDPPSASHITHDNYHTGFILDAILQYGISAGSDEFETAYRHGHRLLRAAALRAERRGAVHERSAVPDRHPRLRPGDHHVLAPAAALRRRRRNGRHGAANGRWHNMWDPASGWFYYQRRRRFRTRIRELRWCQGWMSWALASYLENCGGEA